MSVWIVKDNAGETYTADDPVELKIIEATLSGLRKDYQVTLTDGIIKKVTFYDKTLQCRDNKDQH